MNTTSALVTRSRRKQALSIVVFALFMVVAWLGIRGYALVCAVNALKAHAARPAHVAVEWASAPSPPGRNQDHVYIHVPGWLAHLTSNSMGRVMVSPFCQIHEVRLTNANEMVLDTIAQCQSLRSLALIRIESGSEATWQQILSIPLESLLVVNCGLPHDALSKLAMQGTIRNLRLAGEGPLDLTDLGSCTDLEHLLLENIVGISEIELAAELRKLRRLKRVDFTGVTIRERAIVTLTTIPSLEQVWIHESDVHLGALWHLAKCGNLHTVSLSRCNVDDNALQDLETIKALRRCIVQGESITSPAIDAFREHRPEVVLTILGRLE